MRCSEGEHSFCTVCTLHIPVQKSRRLEGERDTALHRISSSSHQDPQCNPFSSDSLDAVNDKRMVSIVGCKTEVHLILLKELVSLVITITRFCNKALLNCLLLSA